MEPRQFRYYLVLIAFFLTLYLTVAAGLQVLGRTVVSLSAQGLILLILATYRLARIVTMDEVMLPFRFPFVCIRRRDGEEEEEPRPGGFAHAIGQLLTCSGCSGVWVGALLTYAYTLWPQWGALLVLVFGVAGGAHLLDILAAALKRAWRTEP